MMRDSFVGDIGDFANNGLLRYLCGVTDPSMDNPLRLGVVWYRNGAGSVDGNRIDYLNVSDYNNSTFLMCDPNLYSTFREMVGVSLARGIKRTIGQIENLDILPSDTLYYSKSLPLQNNRQFRKKWLNDATEKLEKAKVVFINPDTGIEFKQVTSSRKHASLGELKRFYKEGKSLIIYHHQDRNKEGSRARIDEISEVLRELLPRYSCQALWWHRVSGRFYFILAHPDHKQLHEQVEKFRGTAWFTKPEGKELKHFT